MADTMDGVMLSGHEAAWREWNAAMASARMHHAWILAGPAGIGKGTFARTAAKALVARGAGRQPDAAAHPDILILDHPPTNEEEAVKRAEGRSFQAKRNITVDQIRAMQTRLNTRPTLGDARVVIIDPADDMEKPAVNALLKSLEEPPAGTHFVLVAHRPGRLLATVRSRCRVLRFAPLTGQEVDAILRAEAPEADAATRAAAIAAAHGSPGRALAYVGHGLAPLHALITRILADGDEAMALRGAFAQEIGTRPSRERQAAVFELARGALAAALPVASADRQARIITAHVEIVRLAGQAPTYNFDAGLLGVEIGGLLASAAARRELA